MSCYDPHCLRCDKIANEYDEYLESLFFAVLSLDDIPVGIKSSFKNAQDKRTELFNHTHGDE